MRQVGTRPVRAFIIDPDPTWRSVTMHALSHAGISVRGSAGTLSTALAPVQAMRPDVIVTELAIGPDSILDVCRLAAGGDPPRSLLAYTSHGAESSLRSALGAGLMGHILKPASGERLAAAVRGVALGGAEVSSVLAGVILARLGPDGDPVDRAMLIALALGVPASDLADALPLGREPGREAALEGVRLDAEEVGRRCAALLRRLRDGWEPGPAQTGVGEDPAAGPGGRLWRRAFDGRPRMRS